ncbi:TIGR03792 family protein [Microcoleus sp. FACHB-1515]|uniref:TIGR03792 family protein n=1 Tax=Cyanophyceae TaxID=3028117 RepID=UPI001684A7AA|nr:TIGR03792 family protein [Microcoleus sp. FACHB-1515]MBD2091548.1 TIGR03792 family protein [Microcoleus sp. FACHB-1515]
MVIEWLRVRVEPELRELYVQKDHEIWTAGLSQYPGFLNKEVWISPDRLDEVVLVIRWESFAAWKSIPSDALARLDAEFNAVMGETHEIVDAGGYQVRRFPG